MAYTIEQLREMVGQELGVSDWFTIDQARINQFADVTLDHQWIHVDEARAQNSPFGSTIAHGYLTLALVTHFVTQMGLDFSEETHALNYGADKIRFLAPVPVGSRIRDRVEVAEVTDKGGGRTLVKMQHTIEIEGGSKPAMVAEILFMFFG